MLAPHLKLISFFSCNGRISYFFKRFCLATNSMDFFAIIKCFPFYFSRMKRFCFLEKEIILNWFSLFTLLHQFNSERLRLFIYKFYYFGINQFIYDIVYNYWNVKQKRWHIDFLALFNLYHHCSFILILEIEKLTYRKTHSSFCLWWRRIYPLFPFRFFELFYSLKLIFYIIIIL